MLHILGDILNSVGVIIAAITITARPDWKIVDPICTLFFALIVLITSGAVFKECIDQILETTPEQYDVEGVKLRLREVEGV